MRHIPALILTVASAVVFAMGWHIGFADGTAVWTRLLYQVSHVNVFHLLVNIVCVRSIVASNYRVTWQMWMVAYLISATVPGREIETEGLSGVVYAMFGMMSWQAMNKKVFHGYVAVYLIVGWLMPGVNNMLHVWCYLVGIMYTRLIGKTVR